MELGEVDGEKFFTAKVYALLHDPPNKMWVLRRHEDEAREIYDKVFRGTPFGGGVPPKEDELSRIAKEADVFASTIDRLVFYVGGRRNYTVKYFRYHNVFDPRKSIELPSELGREVNEYVDELGKAVKDACKDKGRRECYHAFYAYYEALWVKRGLPPSLADTRAPTHDVFDHLYASAMMTNWLFLDERPKGFFATIDVPGVQEFVGAGRKAGDFWAGSWIVSMAVWLTVWPLAWDFGPDVLLRPTARLNPFYYAFLTAKLKIDAEPFTDAMNKFGVSLPIGKYGVAQPFIGESAQLVLPPFKFEGDKAAEWSADDVRRAIEGNFRNALECLTSLARGKRRGEEACAHLWEILELEDVKDELIDRLGKFAEVSLPVRIAVIDVGEAYRELACSEELRNLLGDDLCKRILLFDWLLRTRKKAPKGSPLYKSIEQQRKFVPTPGPFFEPGPLNELKPRGPLAVDDGANVFKRSGNWRYCSLCGEEPAVVGVRKDIDPNTRRVIFKREDLEQMFSGIKEDELRKVIRPGEFLGPRCLAKRLIYLVLRKAELQKFESVEDVAMALIKKSGTGLFEEYGKAVGECGKVSEYLKMEVLDLTSKWRDAEEMRRDWELCIRSMGGGVFPLLEGAEFGEFAKYVYDDKSKAEVAETLARPRLFYAVVRGDGDNVGRLLNGYLPFNWYDEVKRVVLELKAEGDVEQFEKDREFALKVLNAAKEYAERIAKEDEEAHPPVLITPTYRVAITRAMTVSALRDWAIVERRDGMLIYAGGDDVIALLPVETSLKAVAELRRNYWGEEGFHRADKYVVPALIAYGRSFSVRYVHMMDIMSKEFAVSYRELEERAKEAKWRTHEKDSLALTCSRIGAKSVLPLRDPAVAEKLEDLWKMLMAGQLSGGTPYDLDATLGGIDVERIDFDAYAKIFEYVIRRNVRESSIAEEVAKVLREGCLYGVEYFEGLKEAMKILRRLP